MRSERHTKIHAERAKKHGATDEQIAEAVACAMFMAVKNDVLERLIEDVRELNEETKKEIKTAIKEIESGKYVTHEQLAKEMG